MFSGKRFRLESDYIVKLLLKYLFNRELGALQAVLHELVDPFGQGVVVKNSRGRSGVDVLNLGP